MQATLLEKTSAVAGIESRCLQVLSTISEEGVPVREIAEAIGRGLKVPVMSKSAEEAAGHFGWLRIFVGRDLIGSSAQTQRRLAWRPTGLGLIAALEQMRYSENPAKSVSAARVRASQLIDGDWPK